MKLAYTMAPGRGDTDLVLERLANALVARGIRCCGTVQINSERPDAGPCVMDVRVLPDGAVLRISQDLGRIRPVPQRLTAISASSSKVRVHRCG